jgi:exopolyphosphatase/guanosine-5'-triphosphate,3'-diphosphate pyrophosphatase
MATLAVIDLGTNTFHLLIVESSGKGNFTEVYRERKFINLAEEGIEQIGDLAMKRAINAIKKFHQLIDLFTIDEIKILGTEALRQARNGPYFVSEVQRIIGHSVEIIGGLREAELIFKGVGLAVDLKQSNHLIMDIGGGSVEFIVSIEGQNIWSQSLPIGVAILYRLFHHREPISQEEINILNTFLEEQLATLLTQCKNHKIQYLTGASGSFEVLSNILEIKNTSHHYFEIEESMFDPIYNQIIQSTYEERLNINGIPAERAQMIVVAMYLVHFILQHTLINKICISDYAIKEGAISEMQLNI